MKLKSNKKVVAAKAVAKTEVKAKAVATKPEAKQEAPAVKLPKLEPKIILEALPYEKDLAIRYRPGFAAEIPKGLDCGSLWKGCKKPTVKIIGTMPKLSEFAKGVTIPAKAKMVRYEANARFILKEEGDWVLTAAPLKGAWQVAIAYKDGACESLGVKSMTAQVWADEQKEMLEYTSNTSAFAKIVQGRLATA